MRTSGRLAALAAGALLALSAACSTAGDGAPPSRAELPHKEPPIAGLSASDLLNRAQAALPDSVREDFLEPAPGYQPTTKSAIGYLSKGAETPNSSTPGISIVWDEDGAVIFIACNDLASAGLSPAIKFCTDLDIPGVPAGGLESVWRQVSAGTWDLSQPFPQITISRIDFDAKGPSVGAAKDFNISGPKQNSAPATNSSSL